MNTGTNRLNRSNDLGFYFLVVSRNAPVCEVFRGCTARERDVNYIYGDNSAESCLGRTLTPTAARQAATLSPAWLRVFLRCKPL